MAISDPQSVTYNAVAQSLPRVSSGEASGVFRKDDGTVQLSISHKTGNRVRHMLRLDHNKVAVDPLVPTINSPYSMSVSMVIDVPKVGYSLVEQKYLIDAFAAWITASSGANTTRVLGGES